MLKILVTEPMWQCCWTIPGPSEDSWLPNFTHKACINSYSDFNTLSHGDARRECLFRPTTSKGRTDLRYDPKQSEANVITTRPHHLMLLLKTHDSSFHALYSRESTMTKNEALIQYLGWGYPIFSFQSQQCRHFFFTRNWRWFNYFTFCNFFLTNEWS